MSAEDVRKLGMEELSQWLKTLLDEDDWKGVELVIRKNDIEGLNFLNCPEAKWEAFGLAWGVANSLFQIAQNILRTEATGVLAGKDSSIVSSRSPSIELAIPSVKDIRDFLTSHMNYPTKFHCVPHVLTETSRSFALSGRDEALKSAAEAFQILSMPVATTNRCQREIPVCSGLPGLGKTRMLEEWERIFDLAEIPPTRLGALMLYNNDHNPHSVEKLITIEASFSWRLLHQLFLEGNGPEFRVFMSKMLPNNAMNLRLYTALKVIRSHLIAREVLRESECLHMFLGIDEYQVIEEVEGVVLTKVGGLLQDLLNAIGDLLSTPIHGTRLYPMFAGTDFSVISIANSSKTEITRIPMTLLSASEIEEAVGALPGGNVLLGFSLVRRHLFYLCGVARWAVEYVERLLCWMDRSQGTQVPPSDFIERVFKKIRRRYVKRWKISILSALMDTSDFLYLAAYSISGCEVEEKFRGKAKVSWDLLHDSSVCVIDDDEGTASVPYAMFHLIANWNPLGFSDEASQAFILTVRSLIDKVDNLVYDKQP